EVRFGAGRGCRDAVVVTLGTGVGGAIIMDGELRRGRFGAAGEIGHYRMVPFGRRCARGNQGCWEQYASGRGLVAEARPLGAADALGPYRMEPFARRSASGNRGCGEKYAGGRGLAAEARDGAAADPDRAARLLELAGGDPGRIEGPEITRAAREGDQGAIDC